MEVNVNFIDKRAKKEYDAIKDDNAKLFKVVERRLDEIVASLKKTGRPTTGEIIPKKELSSKLQKFIQYNGLAALWRVELSDGWRMIYSVGNDGIRIIAFILKLGDHKDYTRFLNQ